MAGNGGGSFKLANNMGYGVGALPPGAARVNSSTEPPGGTYCHQESEMSLLRSEPGRYHQKSDAHCVSISSQSTIMTTLSSSGGNGGHINRSSSVERKHPNGRLPVCRNSTSSFGSRGSGNGPSENGEPGGRLSTIAEKLRRGTKKVLQFSKSPATSPSKSVGSGTMVPAGVAVPAEGKRRWLRKKESVDSCDTNTISNSSLKEYDEEEFSSAELARYMAEVNNEIR